MYNPAYFHISLYVLRSLCIFLYTLHLSLYTLVYSSVCLYTHSLYFLHHQPQIVLMGEIMEVNESATSVTYKIDDRTGPWVDVRRWLEQVRKVFYMYMLYPFLSKRVCPVFFTAPHQLPHHTHIHCSSSYVHTSLPSSLSSQDTPNLESVSCREGMYVRVVGHLRSFNKQRNMMAFHVRPVEDFNEVSHHLSEVIYTHLAVTKGLPVVSWSPLPSNH